MWKRPGRPQILGHHSWHSWFDSWKAPLSTPSSAHGSWYGWVPLCCGAHSPPQVCHSKNPSFLKSIWLQWWFLEKYINYIVGCCWMYHWNLSSQLNSAFALSQEASQKTSSPTFKETGIGPTCKTYPAKTWLYHRIMPFQNCMEASCGQCKSVNLLEGWNRGQKTETEVRPAQPSPSSTPLHLPRDSMAFSNSSTSFQIRLASRKAQEPFFDMFHPCNLATLLRRPRSPTWPPASA